MIQANTYGCDPVMHSWEHASTPGTFSVDSHLGTNLRGPVDEVDETEKFVLNFPGGWPQSHKIKEAMARTPMGNSKSVKPVAELRPTCYRKHKTHQKPASTDLLRTHKVTLKEPPIEIEESDMRDFKIASPPPLVRKGSQLRQWRNRDGYKTESAALNSPSSAMQVHEDDMKLEFENSVPPDIISPQTAVTPMTVRKNIASLAPPKVVRKTKCRERHKRWILSDSDLDGNQGATGMVLGETLERCPLAPVDHLSLHCHEVLTATDFQYSAEDWSARFHSEMLLRARGEPIVDLAIQCQGFGVPDENEVEDEELKGYFGLI